YLNELTGLCRPEELVKLFHYSTQLARKSGVPIESAMISDVPGYTWGTVAAMQEAGIKYFSVAPNYFDRIGNILQELENKPFWWVGPDGKSRVLAWIPYRGYALSHIYHKLSGKRVQEICAGMAAQRYPYDIAYIRWSGQGDNAPPDASICDFVRDWNASHHSPRFVIASTDTAFRAFEARYGDQIPEFRGDWTPYWEDGAGSSSFETALNRGAADRLTQAEALWAVKDPRRYPAQAFHDAWRYALLYSEHTWGAHCSIGMPTIPFTVEQWSIKQAYALAANQLSRQLASAAMQNHVIAESSLADESLGGQFVDLYNTQSWKRSEVAIVQHELSREGDAVFAPDGKQVPSQRLASGELAFLVEDLPPFSGRRYRIGRGEPVAVAAAVHVDKTTLDNGRVAVRLDEVRGGVAELKANDVAANLVDGSAGHVLNDYLYLLGDDPADVQTSDPAAFSIVDRGPLVATVRVASEAPGCWELRRDVRLIAGADHVELHNTVDKRRLHAASYHANEGKESVNFAFPLNVPGGRVRLDVPLAVMEPEKDQIPSACKNWFTIGRWADVSNDDYGATIVTLDAPLMQVGGLTATLLNSQSDPAVWRSEVEPTSKLYSWVMNNHWGTNYRAFQEGPVMFRYAVRPHGGPASDCDNAKFAVGFTQPLLAFPGRGAAPVEEPLLSIESDAVIVQGLKPAEEGDALVVRLLNVSDDERLVDVKWHRQVGAVSQSTTTEEPGAAVSGPLTVPARALVTLRAELPSTGEPSRLQANR
ncbi:MAG: hypothetical protein KDA61_21195, partial [Planctomycetales bacterium]|nr:hypothetical protein [Planctomycetales bacterium]